MQPSFTRFIQLPAQQQSSHLTLCGFSSPDRALSIAPNIVVTVIQVVLLTKHIRLTASPFVPITWRTRGGKARQSPILTAAKCSGRAATEVLAGARSRRDLNALVRSQISLFSCPSCLWASRKGEGPRSSNDTNQGTTDDIIKLSALIAHYW